MKVLYITNAINGSGGLERVLSIKTSSLVDKLGYSITILTLNNGHHSPFYEFDSRVEMLSIAVHGNFMTYLYNYRRKIQEVVSSTLPDAICVCDDGIKGFFLPLLINTSAKFIYERHASIALNTSRSWKGRLAAFLMQSRVKDFDAFVVLTTGGAKEWKGDNIFVIPNPISFQTERSSALDQKRIIVVGSHSYNKGYDLLLELWSKVGAKFPEWCLDIYGKKDAGRRFENLATSLNLKRVNFYDPVVDIKTKYLESSVLLLPSRSEGFGMVLIEAMECGVPCIAFDCPSGPADIINNGHNGFLIDNMDISKFENCVESILDDLNLRKALGRHAKQDAERYSVDRIMGQWKDLFETL